jgi:hypothetical protein
MYGKTRSSFSSAEGSPLGNTPVWEDPPLIFERGGISIG